MKLFVKLMVGVLLLGVAGLFVLKRPDGKPWLDYQAFIPNIQAYLQAAKGAKETVAREVSDLTDSPAPKTTTVYKWRDANGVWQYSDTPPENTASDIVVVNNNTNIIQATPLPDNAESEERPRNTGGSVTYIEQKNQDTGEDNSDALLKGGLENVMSDAKNIQQVLDQRQQAMQQQIDR